MIQLNRQHLLVLLLSGLVFLGACSSEQHRPEEETMEEDMTSTDAMGGGMQDEGATAQQKAAWVRAYLEMADKAVSEGRLAAAKAEVLNALNVDSKNAEATAKLQEINIMMGEGAAAQDLANEVIAHKKAMRAKQVAEVNDCYARALQHYNNNDLADAKKQLELARLVIEYDAYQTDFAGMDQNVKQLAAEVDREIERTAAAREKKQYQDAYDRLKAEEDRDQARRAEKVRHMMIEAIEAFERQDFDDSEHIAQQVLDMTPSFRQAKDLVQMSRQARSVAWREAYYKKRREQLQVWKMDMRDAQIPWQRVIQFPSRSVWDDITSKRQKTDAVADALEDSDAVRVLKNKLSVETVSWEFEDMTLTEVISHIRDTQGVNIYASRLALEEKGEETINFKVRELNFGDALKTALQPLELTYTYRNNSIVVVGVTEASGQIIPRVYEVRDLTIKLPDFRPPNLTLRPGPAGEASMIAVFGEEGEPVIETEPEQLIDLVRDNVQPLSWDIEGRSLELSAGQLVAVTTPQIHREIDNFLEDLRRFTKVIVHVETRVIALREGFLSEFGLDIRGTGTNPGNIALLDDVTNGPEDNASVGGDNGGAGIPAASAQSPSSGAFFRDGNDLDFRARSENIFNNALGSFLTSTGGTTIGFTFLDDLELGVVFNAVEKSAFANVLTAPRLTIYNNQRANLTLVNQIAYVKDYDVEVAQTAFIADPLVDIVQDGLVLDVRPTVSHDRRYVTLELRPTVAILARPIQTFVTPLAGLTTNVIIELPELEYRAAATTVRVPDRGWVVIGGLKSVTTVDRRSEVPILSDIPILSFFFSRKGRSDEISDLILLLHVRIIDLEEEEARLAR